jgi:hypothetical protein
MVIAAPDGEVELECGGVPMTDGEGNTGGSVDASYAEGTALGKRYVNEDGGLELLCVKPGDGSLSTGGEALKVKDAKKLPKTD